MKDYQNFIGIDVSKSKFDISVLDRRGTLLSYNSFENSRRGIEDAISFLKNQCEAVPEKWLFCMEHTGIYTLPICSYLSEQKLNYTLVPALQIKRSTGIRRGKSDKSDSRDIAKYIYLFRNEITCYTLPEGKLIALKSLLGERERMVKALKMLKVADKENAAFQASYTSYSTAVKDLMTTTIKNLDRDILDMVRGDDKLQEVYDLLTSIPGIGPQTACYLIIYTRCFTIFKNARKLACYAGIAPFPFSSGSSIKGRSRVHPLGNKRLKSLLNMAALNAVRIDPELKLYYEKKCKEGKNAMLVLNVIRNKLIHRAFSTVKRGTPYVQVMKYAA